MLYICTVVSTLDVASLPFSRSVVVEEIVVMLVDVIKSGKTKGIDVWAVPSCRGPTVDVTTVSNERELTATERLASQRSNEKSITSLFIRDLFLGYVEACQQGV